MELEVMLPIIVGILLIVFLLSFALRLLNQPHVVGYILAGVLIGPAGLGLIQNNGAVSLMGELGIILLLFFIGMKVSVPKLFKNWRVAVLGTATQVGLTIAAMALIGAWLRWPLELIILMGFVISLSSTAVVLKILEEWGELHTRIGQNVLSILLVQDLAIIPMIMIVEFLGKNRLDSGELGMILIGGLFLLHILVYVFRHPQFELPFAHHLPQDRETQVLVALIVCFGMAGITGFFGISAALGAFVAGIVVAASNQTKWVHHSLDPFRVVFVAMFFIYVGLLIDIHFVQQYVWLIMILVLLILAINTVMNAGILRMLGDKWKTSIYGGAQLSEIGEFSFLIGTVGWRVGLIPDVGYQLVLSIISLTLLVSPFWILLFKHLLGFTHKTPKV